MMKTYIASGKNSIFSRFILENPVEISQKFDLFLTGYRQFQKLPHYSVKSPVSENI